jgi:ferrous iron transport protein B
MNREVTAVKPRTLALAGNPNCGKTTLFNALTGSNYQVGNWAGVTVERKEGTCRGMRLVDLPGIYSLTSESAEEAIAKDYILEEMPDVIINIVDATSLERNLYLTTQLVQMKVPVVVALNMMDALGEVGLSIDTEKLRSLLGVPVVPISASRGDGIKALLDAVAQASVKVPSSSVQMDSLTDAESRYRFLSELTSKCTRQTGPNKQFTKTEQIDRIALGTFWAIPLFFLVMFLIFQVTFGPFGSMLSDLCGALVNEHARDVLLSFLEHIHACPFLISLIMDGILVGVGSVLTFFPQIMLLFLFLSFLEDSGYMARTAFIMDRFFMRLGLSGKSFVPLIMGFGCTVPAVMASRTLENPRDRLLTILLTPFMSCGAKMPVYAVFAAALFPSHRGLVVFSLYLLGICMAVLSGICLNTFVLKGSPPPLLLELPPYRMPTAKNTLRHMWEKAKEFAVRAGTILLLASIAIWLLQNFNLRLRMVASKEMSMLGMLGKTIAPIFSPCGFGNWEAAVSLLSGFAAKEAILSSLGILLSGSGVSALSSVLPDLFSPASAYAFLVFVLLYVPCIAAVSAIRSETGSLRWTLFSCLWQLALAWTVSMLVFQIGSLFC